MKIWAVHMYALTLNSNTLLLKKKQKNLQFLGDFPSHLNIKMPISQPTDKINVCCGYSFSSLEHRIILYIFYFDALKFLFWFCSCKVEWVEYLVRACTVQTYLAVLYKFLAHRQKAIIKSSALWSCISCLISWKDSLSAQFPAVLFKIIETKQTCLKSCYFEDSWTSSWSLLPI